MLYSLSLALSKINVVFLALEATWEQRLTIMFIFTFLMDHQNDVHTVSWWEKYCLNMCWVIIKLQTHTVKLPFNYSCYQQ